MVEGPLNMIGLEGTRNKDEWWKQPLPSRSIVPGKSFQESWESRSEEVFFPSLLEPHWPWKQYHWFEELSSVRPDVIPPHNITIDNYSFLIHVTHNKEFQMITRSRPNGYTLRAQRKVGKNGYKKYDGTPVGHSFVSVNVDEIPNNLSEYRYISSGESLLPGKYIWWSVYIDNPLQIPKSYRPSIPFTKPDTSPYGRNMIYGQFEDVLATYQASFPLDHRGRYPTIELRVGGTLRYKFEVCYVIILCKSGIKELEEYPMWEEGRNKIKFDKTNNIVTIIDPINITLNSSIKSSNGINCSWDHFVFALYFDGDEEMICHQGPFDHQPIEHSACLKRKPGPHNTFVCPDELS